MKELFKGIGESLKELLVFLEERLLKISLLVAVISWAVVLLPATVADSVGVTSLLTAIRQWFGLAGIVFSVLSASLLLYRGGKCIVLKRKRANLLANLTPAERNALKAFLDAKGPAVPFSLYDGVQFALIEKGILKRADSLPNEKNEQDFIIADWAHRWIKKNPTILN